MADRGQSNRTLQDKNHRSPGIQDIPSCQIIISTLVWWIGFGYEIYQRCKVPAANRCDPTQRDPTLWCDFHGIHGHRIGDCQHLCEEVAMLLENDHLR